MYDMFFFFFWETQALVFQYTIVTIYNFLQQLCVEDDNILRSWEENVLNEYLGMKRLKCVSFDASYLFSQFICLRKNIDIII